MKHRLSLGQKEVCISWSRQSYFVFISFVEATGMIVSLGSSNLLEYLTTIRFNSKRFLPPLCIRPCCMVGLVGTTVSN